MLLFKLLPVLTVGIFGGAMELPGGFKQAAHKAKLKLEQVWEPFAELSSL
jgi:hypothetical protein